MIRGKMRDLKKKVIFGKNLLRYLHFDPLFQNPGVTFCSFETRTDP